MSHPESIYNKLLPVFKITLNSFRPILNNIRNVYPENINYPVQNFKTYGIINIDEQLYNYFIFASVNPLDYVTSDSKYNLDLLKYIRKECTKTFKEFCQKVDNKEYTIDQNNHIFVRLFDSYIVDQNLFNMYVIKTKAGNRVISIDTGIGLSIYTE